MNKPLRKPGKNTDLRFILYTPIEVLSAVEGLKQSLADWDYALEYIDEWFPISEAKASEDSKLVSSIAKKKRGGKG